jgi:two-component system chemotaxis response regulator CheB
MVSSLTEDGADITLDALEVGAIDYVTKPKLDLTHTLENYSEELIAKVKAAASVNVENLQSYREVSPKNNADAVIQRKKSRIQFKTTDKLIAIGASTGGTEAIKEVLMRMPADAPGIVITQHIPVAFSQSFATRMDDLCAMTVYQAEDGQQILPGHVYIAPGDRHLLVERSGARFICRLNDGPPVNRHKPSVDVMFRSIAQNIGANAVSVLLTGMGEDGAQGMLEMHEVGSPTIIQDERSSVVWGMPGAAKKLNCVDMEKSLEKISATVLDVCHSMHADIANDAAS